MSKSIKVDSVSFNAAHYKGWKEADFIKDQLASVPDRYGNEAAKTEFLKKVYAIINPAKADVKAAVKKEGPKAEG